MHLTFHDRQTKENAVAELKTKPHAGSVDAFLASVSDETKRQDCAVLRRLMEKITGAEARLWGPSIVGFGSYHYRYESGREGDWFLTGFSPRKRNLTIYVMAGFSRYEELLAKLGKHKTGKSCLYVNRLADLDLEVLAELIESSVEHVRKSNA